VGPSKLAKFLIIVKAPKLKANVTCPLGKLKDDCMPRITKIDDQGMLTIIFPVNI